MKEQYRLVIHRDDTCSVEIGQKVGGFFRKRIEWKAVAWELSKDEAIRLIKTRAVAANAKAIKHIDYFDEDGDLSYERDCRLLG